ncbi:MAG: molybdenum cofactor guanylyltransferase [Chloroflexota bacterium]|nr:molybdenum cofactor guanylyltransferase [Chloroflexota bacterium]MDE2908884.1 molybdenum cofactor guanylyltransferase [Chloroflexota bacterium]
MKPATWLGLSFSLAIIAGGQSRRMGRDKAFVELGGKALIEHVIRRSADLAQADTILITNKPAQYARLGLPMRQDILPNKGSLGGIYTALLSAKRPDVLVLACDMPFVNISLLRYMVEQMDEDIDIVVPTVDGYPQGLHAIYKKTCIEPIARQLAADRLKIIRFYGQMRVRYLDETDYAAFDPLGRSFVNLNTPEELAEAELLLRAAD